MTQVRRTRNAAGLLKRQRGRPVGDHEAKRIELLKAAEAVIAEEGFAAASLRKVARRAGGTTGGITYYFANKEAMNCAVMEYLYDKFEAWLDAATRDGIDIKKLIEDYIFSVGVDEPEINLVAQQLHGHAMHNPEFGKVIQRRYARYRRKLADAIRIAQEQGRIRNDIPADILADQISAMGDGWGMMFPIEHDRFKPRRVKALLDAVMTLLAPNPAAKG